VVAPEDPVAQRRAVPPAPVAGSPREPKTIELGIAGPIRRVDIPHLCSHARRLLESGGADRLICDVGALVDPDAVTIDALARLQLTAHRVGGQIGLRNASRELRQLLDFAGLRGVVPLSRGSRVEAGRQAEEREVLGGVQEERDPADPIP
jgi:ABC-type transporter Mla MlaB component